ncbi:MAG: hypothetical protein O2973_04095 [Gemmatimonadetes bacterium]|nr:hypothetical protein [Gemmatimonadota bacterium]
MRGRTVAWATQLADGTDVVIRHSHHGGALARLTRDLFLAPSRAPYELAASLRLHASGVHTPDVIAYVTYAAIGPLCRADVATALVPGADFPAAWAADRSPPGRAAIVDAVGALLCSLQAAGAHHPDLNAKNVLVSGSDDSLAAWVLDVDRVAFSRRGDHAVGHRNTQRLLASLRKWNTLHGLDFGDADAERLLSSARNADVARSTPEQRTGMESP